MARWKMVHGYTHSRNAEEAEERGELPITRAVKAVYEALECKKRGVSLRKVREFLEEKCQCGWHHVSGPNRVRAIGYYRTWLSDDEERQLLGTFEEPLETGPCEERGQ